MQSSYGKRAPFGTVASAIPYAGFGAADTSAASFPEMIAVLKGLTQNPCRRAELLPGYIAHAKAARMPSVIITDLESRLRVAKRDCAIQQEGETATRDWRFLGQTSSTALTITGIAVGAAFVYFLVKKAG